MQCLLLASCAMMDSSKNKKFTGEIRQHGIYFKSYVQVEHKAIERAQYIVELMLQNSPDIKTKMEKNNFVVEIIGQKQNITELPRYRHLKNQNTFDGRSFDEGTRGLGGADACSVGEENLLCFTKQKFWNENILVHEFAHSIKYFMPAALSEKVDQAFANAKKKNLYPKDIYMMADSHEYWAEATQTWFNATSRQDVNGGINSRALIKKHDPEISSLLKFVYGEVEMSRLNNCLY